MQVDPIKPALKAPRTQHLKPIYNEPLSNFAFKFILRRYTKPVLRRHLLEQNILESSGTGAVAEAGAFIRPLFSST